VNDADWELLASTDSTTIQWKGTQKKMFYTKFVETHLIHQNQRI